MPRGRPKKPLNELAASTIRQNPNRYRHLRVLAAGDPPKPTGLTEAESKIFGALVHDMASLGVLEPHHGMLLTALAVEWVAYRGLPVTSPERDKTFGRVLKLMRECGLTPASIVSIQRPRDEFAKRFGRDDDDETAFERMFQESYGPPKRKGINHGNADGTSA